MLIARARGMVLAWFLLALPIAALADAGDKVPQLPEACSTDCVSPYGEVLGTAAGGVPAYSNCSARCVVPAPNTLNGVYTGLKWQCVEYARRWLLVNRGEVYGDVDIAADIWQIPFVTRVSDGKKFRMIN